MGDVVALIPARGGSKGIPRKNLQPIDGIPLVGWSIRAALAAESVDRVYVSTEDAEIAAVAEQFGATVICRPKKLASDTADAVPVMHHALEAIKNSVGFPDVMVYMECTSPFTTPADIDGAVAQYHAQPETDIVAGCCRDHTYQLRPTAAGIDWVSFNRIGEDNRRQDLPETYRLVGGVTVFRAAGVVQHHCAYWGVIRIYEIPEARCCDIDTPLDLYLARALASYQDQWIVCGSSPSAREGLQAARLAHPTALTITTNAANELFTGDDRPDFYHLHDSTACVLHQSRAQAFRAKGTRLITLARRDPRALVSRGVDGFDEFLTLVSHAHPGRFVKGAYASCGLSGLMILQYALNHDARGVHLVGLEGYGDSGHYFNGDQDLGFKKNQRFTTELIRPFVQSCIDACPETQFTFYGHMNYPVTGDNVTVIKDLPICDSHSTNDGDDSDPETSETCPTVPQMC